METEDTQHTPGPWKIWFDDEDSNTWCVTSDYQVSPGVPELDIWVWRSEASLEIREANAKLIASAPDMFNELASLRELLKQKEEVIRELITIVEYYHDKQVQYTEMPYKNWNAIIEKAKIINL